MPDPHPPALGFELEPSPALRRPILRSESQARLEREQRQAREHDARIVAGLLTAADSLVVTAARLQDECRSELGRVACARVIDAVDQLRAALVFRGDA